MVGMEPVERKARSLAAQALVAREREDDGLPVSDRTNHLVFTGNPGVGKTSVARIFKDLYYGLGLIEKDTYKEAKTSDLMAGYMGQTPERTSEFLESGKGGVIFIDEAYKFSQGERNEYGQQVLDEILTFADDHKSDTVIILAGYPEGMKHLLASNPGLPRRFPNVIELPDIDREGMSEVMRRKLSSSMDKLGHGAGAEMKRALDSAYPALKTGNAGEVNNLLEKIQIVRDERIATLPSRSTKDKVTITAEDVRGGTRDYLTAHQAKGGKLVATGKKKTREPA